MDRLLWVTWGGEGLKHGQVIIGHLGREGLKHGQVIIGHSSAMLGF